MNLSIYYYIFTFTITNQIVFHKLYLYEGIGEIGTIVKYKKIYVFKERTYLLYLMPISVSLLYLDVNNVLFDF